MIVRGLLNPHVSSLLARVRHTNTLVIADRGFPFWPQIETIDLSVVDDLPTVTQVVRALLANWKIGRAFMAAEFNQENSPAIRQQFAELLKPTAISFEPHVQFKLRVPSAIGLIRTGDTIPYANMILESA